MSAFTFLGLLGWIANNERSELVAHVNSSLLATGLAVSEDCLGFGEHQICFGILARSTENEFIDEDIEKFPQLVRIVGAVDNVTIRLLVGRRLSTQFETEKLGSILNGIDARG